MILYSKRIQNISTFFFNTLSPVSFLNSPAPFRVKNLQRYQWISFSLCAPPASICNCLLYSRETNEDAAQITGANNAEHFHSDSVFLTLYPDPESRSWIPILILNLDPESWIPIPETWLLMLPKYWLQRLPLSLLCLASNIIFILFSRTPHVSLITPFSIYLFFVRNHHNKPVVFRAIFSHMFYFLRAIFFVAIWCCSSNKRILWGFFLLFTTFFIIYVYCSIESIRKITHNSIPTLFVESHCLKPVEWYLFRFICSTLN